MYGQYTDTGIYVLMFESIFKTFFKMIILTILLVVTFALAFYMAFRQFDPLFTHSPFASPFRALIKTFTMTTGELDFENIFGFSSGGVAPDEFTSDVPFPAISFILWIMFLILMPILLANMLVCVLCRVHIKIDTYVTACMHSGSLRFTGWIGS